jgi:hypothetical protein
MDIIFEKIENFECIFGKPIKPFKSETPVSPEDTLLNNQSELGIKVQSVALPTKNYSIAPKTEPEVIDWLQNKIHSRYSAYYQMKKKYKEDSNNVNWNNNKVQNIRFLETKKLFEKGLY